MFAGLYKFVAEQTEQSELLSQVDVLSLVSVLLKPLVLIADVRVSHQSKVILIQMDDCFNLEKLNIYDSKRSYLTLFTFYIQTKWLGDLEVHNFWIIFFVHSNQNVVV